MPMNLLTVSPTIPGYFAINSTTLDRDRFNEIIDERTEKVDDFSNRHRIFSSERGGRW
jgi:hypothetical protein